MADGPFRAGRAFWWRCPCGAWGNEIGYAGLRDHFDNCPVAQADPTAFCVTESDPHPINWTCEACGATGTSYTLCAHNIAGAYQIDARPRSVPFDCPSCGASHRASIEPVNE